MLSLIRNLQIRYFTVRNLRKIQIMSRIYYFVRNRLIGRGNPWAENLSVYLLSTREPAFLLKRNSATKDAAFTFCNKTHIFGSIEEIDFGWFGHGELWCYQLNYFMFCTQKDIDYPASLALLKEWESRRYPSSHITWDPYPVSIRIGNLIKWGTRFRKEIDPATMKWLSVLIDRHVRYLSHNLEYHLMGNHLMENLIALCIGTAVTGQQKFFARWWKKLLNQLDEQIFADGFHFERSIMYHGILLERLIELYSCLEAPYQAELLPFIQKMISVWIAFRYMDGSFPAFNDVLRDEAEEMADIVTLAEKAGVLPDEHVCESVPVRDFAQAGYTVYTSGGVKCVIDTGPIGPSYIPGHGHCDALSFELWVDKGPLFVNAGTSSYDTGQRRMYERSTKAHNTLAPAGKEQSEIWSRFRVARQAEVKCGRKDFSATGLIIEGMLISYDAAFSHTRRIECDDENLAITDIFMSGKEAGRCFLYFHLFPGITAEETTKGMVLAGKYIFASDTPDLPVRIEPYDYALGLNMTTPALCIIVDCGYSGTVTTRITRGG